MRNDSSDPTLDGCTFTDNLAVSGGAMVNGGSNLVLTNCAFIGNTATSNSGGAIHNFLQTSPTFTNCAFIGNSAEVEAGRGISGPYGEYVLLDLRHLGEERIVSRLPMVQELSKIYIGVEDGMLYVYKADKKLELLGEVDMGAPIYSSAVAANGVLYISTESHLYAFSKNVTK